MDGAPTPQHSECHCKPTIQIITNHWHPVKKKWGKYRKLGTITIKIWLSWAHTWPADPWGIQVCWGRCGEEGQWRGQQHEPNPDGNTAIHSTQHEQQWSLHGPLYLQRHMRKKAREACDMKCHHPQNDAISLMLSPTLHLSRSNHISSRHAGHIHQVYRTTSLQWQAQLFIYQ